jgi:microcystin-dependent protein
MANYEATKYDFSGANLTGLQGVNTGIIVPWSNASVPSGFLECNGAAVSRTTYSALFAVVSTTYGVGDGSTTFNVPDLTDRVAIGKSPSYALASTGGANSVTSTGNIAGSVDATTLTAPVMAAHSHPSSTGSGNSGPKSNGPERQPGPNSSPAGSATPQPAGGGLSHTHPMAANFVGGDDSVLQPYLTVMYIIKT